MQLREAIGGAEGLGFEHEKRAARSARGPSATCLGLVFLDQRDMLPYTAIGAPPRSRPSMITTFSSNAPATECVR